MVPRLFEVAKSNKPGTHANRVWKNQGKAQVLVSASAERSSRGIDDSSTFTIELQESPRMKRESLDQPSGLLDRLPDLKEDSKESLGHSGMELATFDVSILWIFIHTFS